MADNQLPHTDTDLLLARQLGILNQTDDSTSIEDPLFDILVNYKTLRKEAASTQTINSSAIWDAIAGGMKQNRADKATIFTLSSTKMAWAAAASILIIALAGIFYFSTFTKPTLVASSQQQIQTATLNDGSTITLRPHTKLFSLADNKNKRSFKLEGEAYFEVTSDPNRAFSVEAGNGTVTVLGTKFTLSSWGNQTQIYLEEGSVQFDAAQTNNSIVLEPGQAASIDLTKNIHTKDLASADEYTDWINSEIIFDNRTAEYIFQELEQQFDINIEAPDSVLSISLSGGIDLQDRSQSLSYLEKVLGGSFESTGNKSFTFIPND